MSSDSDQENNAPQQGQAGETQFSADIQMINDDIRDAIVAFDRERTDSTL